MSNRLEEMVDELSSLNLQIKHDMERVEAKVEHINQVVLELSKTGLLDGCPKFFVGRTLQPEGDERGPADGMQAALLVPDGFGVVEWDVEDYLLLKESGTLDSEREIRRRFKPFQDCTPTDKKFLLPCIEELLEDLTDIALVAASKLDPQPGIAADDYFLRRANNNPQE